MRLQKISQGKQLRSTCSPQLLLLCLFVAVGAIIGFFVQKTVSTESNAELCEYLHQYAACSAQGSCTPVSFLRVAAVYFRYPLLAFCLGFCAFGIYLLPLPYDTILRRYREMGGEVITLGSDAHASEHIGCAIAARQQLLRDCGFRYFTTFTKGEPTFRPL